tara:strand:+ start:662 stop:877 length:216 start_codon:yes stop_codon:yes gene_type:complete
MELYNNLNNKIMLEELENIYYDTYYCEDLIQTYKDKISNLNEKLRKLKLKKVDLKCAIKDKVGMDLDNLQK